MLSSAVSLAIDTTMYRWITTEDIFILRMVISLGIQVGNRAVLPLDKYECRHGMNYTRIIGQKNEVEANVLFFVPLHKNCEIQQMKLRNLGNSTKHLKVFSFQEWCLWNAATDMENFQRNFSTGEVEIEGSTIYHKTEYREREIIMHSTM